MNPSQPFKLVPFEPLPPSLALTLGGTCQRTVTRSAHSLKLHYLLEGNLDAVVIPEPSSAPSRSDGLWQSTCLECFFAKPGESAYWEMNLSPSGDWNVYQLQDYREGLFADPSVTAISHQLDRSATGLALSATIPLPLGLDEACQLDLAICAVIALRDGSTTYWALRHTGTVADFHRRDSFALTV